MWICHIRNLGECEQAPYQWVKLWILIYHSHMEKSAQGQSSHTNECPPWSELGIANQVHLWNLKSTAYLSEVRNFVLQNGFAETDIVHVAIITMHQLLMVACCRSSVVHHH